MLPTLDDRITFTTKSIGVKEYQIREVTEEIRSTQQDHEEEMEVLTARLNALEDLLTQDIEKLRKLKRGIDQ